MEPAPLLMAATVGLLTGTFIVLLNYAVHWEEDVFRSLPDPLPRFAPAIAGAMIGGLMLLRGQGRLEGGTDIPSLRASNARPPKDWTMAPTRAIAAAITLGGGNSLGPEGPSVEIGANVAVVLSEASLGRGGRSAEGDDRERANFAIRQNLLAAGCASGIAAGFNAPVSGLFFALESVRPEGSPRSRSLAPSMQLLAAVLAATVSQLGLGSNPAVNLDKVKWEPRDSLWELPLFLVLGACVGVAAAALKFAIKLARGGFTELEKSSVPTWAFPVLAGLLVTAVSGEGLQEVLYKGFENVNLVLAKVDGDMIQGSISEDLIESKGIIPDLKSPTVAELQPGHLADLLVAKILLTAVCVASGQVGGLFAPALFLGVSLGGLFGRCLRDYFWSWPLAFGDIHAFSVPVTYAIVGMAASLGAVCGVPLTAVVLLLELSGGDDYGVILPTVAAVGVAVYVEDLLTSAANRSGQPQEKGRTGFLTWLVNSVERALEVPAVVPDRPQDDRKVEDQSTERLPGTATASSAREQSDTPSSSKQVIDVGLEAGVDAAGTVLSVASQAFAVVEPSDSAQELLRRLRAHRVDAAVVLADDGAPLGVLTSTSLLRASRRRADADPVATLVTAGELLHSLRLEGRPPAVAPSTPLRLARATLQECGPGAALLVVGEGQRLVGVAYLADVERELRLEDAERELRLPAGAGTAAGESTAERARAASR